MLQTNVILNFFNRKVKYLSNISREVERGKLSERIGRKVMGLKDCRREPAENK
jgi:hypothetical protein